MPSEVANKASFTEIRYAQCWEDADVLLEGLDIQPGDICVSIASAGDNALAMLARSPAQVIALDLSDAQLACVDLRVAAYRELDHCALLELIGSRPSTRRPELYRRCRPLLSPSAAAFWDARGAAIDIGIGHAGKFERYFELFRTRILPLIHAPKSVYALLAPKSLQQRREFYDTCWNNRRWRALFRVFFSRTVMGRAGRDPSFFAYVEGSVADRILARTRYALTELDTSVNPYLHWILIGRHGDALPFALRPENFEAIRANLDRLTWRRQSLEDFLEQAGDGSIDRFNLSDIFEYMSAENYAALLGRIARAGRRGGRLAYWNMLAPRARPESLAERLAPLTDLGARLHAADKAFFYSAFVLEEVA